MKIDEEEARYQAALRKDAIERAKTMLYYKTDRVRGFHVSQMFQYYYNIYILI